MRCLARDPASRWPDARAFKQSLGAALDEDSDRLPGELREVAGAVFWSVITGWILANLARFVLPEPVGRWSAVPAALIAALAFAATAVVHHRKGFSWAELWRVAGWPPAWWPFWWPAALRRPEDLWDRLPRTVRLIRSIYGVIAATVVLALPVALNPSTRWAFLVLIAVGWIAVAAVMVFVAWWAHRSGIPNDADLRSLFFRSSTDRRFWKRPQMARRLLAAPGGSTVERSPQTPAEYVRHIVENTQQLTGRARDAGLKAVDAARFVFSTIEELDREVARLKKDDDVSDTACLAQRREELARTLETLWTDHLALSPENTDAAIHRLIEAARLSTENLGVNGTAASDDDSETMSLDHQGRPLRL